MRIPKRQTFQPCAIFCQKLVTHNISQHSPSFISTFLLKHLNYQNMSSLLSTVEDEFQKFWKLLITNVILLRYRIKPPILSVKVEQIEYELQKLTLNVKVKQVEQGNGYVKIRSIVKKLNEVFVEIDQIE